MKVDGAQVARSGRFCRIHALPADHELPGGPQTRLHITLLAGLVVLAAQPLASGPVPRTGFVTLQFDDSHEYCYSRIFPALEQHGLKASFGYITEDSDLGMNNEPWKMQEIYRAGHEVQDHTTRHDFQWATAVDTLDDGVDEFIPWTFADLARWDSLCDRSRDYLGALGIRAYGWNQPGGGGGPGSVPGHPGWRWMGAVDDSLYDLVASPFSYAVGAGVDARTAHLNLRGHNCPERFPFFNVPHVTVDDLALEETETGIADAVASGLWYLAVSHAADSGQVARAESLIDWLAESGIEVVTCRAGVERVQSGVPERYANQLPQAGMLSDLDGNGKPDGFLGACARDTLTAPPVAGLGCLALWGAADFACYGPEVGRSSLSLWLKSATGSPATLGLAYAGIDFDQQVLAETWTTLPCPVEWTRVDSLVNPALAFDVADEIDRISFLMVASAGSPIVVACPELILVPGEASGVGLPPGGPGWPAGLSVSPNPVRAGELLWVESRDPIARVAIYDVAGRCVRAARPAAGRPGVEIDTGGLASGVYVLRADPEDACGAKVVVVK